MHRPATICLLLLILTACSGDSATSPTTPRPAATTTPAPVTTATPSPTTDSAPATNPTTTQAPPPPIASTTPPTATPTTAQTATTEPTDTTLDPTIDEAVQLQLAAAERPKIARAAALRLFQDPHNDELLAELDNYYTGRLLEGLTNVAQQLRDGNYRAVLRPDEPEVYEPDPKTLTMNLDAGTAMVQVCHVQTALTVETGGNPDGTDRIARDEITQEIVQLHLELIDGVWMVASARTPVAEVAECP